LGGRYTCRVKFALLAIGRDYYSILNISLSAVGNKAVYDDGVGKERQGLAIVPRGKKRKTRLLKKIIESLEVG